MAEDKDQTSPWVSPRFILSAVMMLLLVAAGVWLWVSHDAKPQSQQDPGGPASSVPEPVAATADTGASDSACGMAAGPQDVPTAMPVTTKVALSPLVSIHVSSESGPRQVDGVPRCFAHSPSGALMSAATFMEVFSSRRDLDKVATQSLASGPERDRMVSQIKAEWDGSSVKPMQVLGFKVAVRGPDEVLVTLACGLPDDASKMMSWPLQMVWDEGDWKVKAPGNDDWGQAPLSGLAGFTLWHQ